MIFTSSSSNLLELIGVSCRRWDRKVVENLNWNFRQGESWAVIGPNGSGKSTLAGLILDRLPYFQGNIYRRGLVSGVKRIIRVSFDQQKTLIEDEEQKDQFESFSGVEEKMLTVRQMIEASFYDGNSKDFSFNEALKIARKMGLEEFIERPFRYLSNGEARKTLLVQALLRQPEFLILDEPFDGLDKESSAHLSILISEIIQRETPLMLITHRIKDLVSDITHILCLKDGKVFDQGPRDLVLKRVINSNLYGGLFDKTLDITKDSSISKKISNTKKEGSYSHISEKRFGEPVIRMNSIHVAYEAKTILKDFNWTVLRGENWRICGPNGAGKSTLLSLISGDHLQAYANDISIFGKQRGEGESVWEIKQQLGIVTAELQVHYQQSLSSIKVVYSGFYDTIGLYRSVNLNQIIIARQWMDQLGLRELSEHDYLKLSQGQQRMILIARAMVKSPSMLILDEPCQGLDPDNRGRLLHLIDQIGLETTTQLIYVTHIPDDHLECLDYELRFEATKDGGFSTRIL